HLPDNIKWPELRDANSYFWVLKISAAEFGSELLFKLLLRQAGGLDRPGRRQGDKTAGINLIIAAERGLAINRDANLLSRLQPRRSGRGLFEGLALRFRHWASVAAAAGRNDEREKQQDRHGVKGEPGPLPNPSQTPASRAPHRCTF